MENESNDSGSWMAFPPRRERQPLSKVSIGRARHRAVRMVALSPGDERLRGEEEAQLDGGSPGMQQEGTLLAAEKSV